MTTPDELEPKSTQTRAARRRTRMGADVPPRRDSTPVALAIVGVLLGLAALAIAVLNVTGVIGRSGGGIAAGTCQRLAWSALPRPSEVAVGWSVQAPEYEVSRVSATLVGPTDSTGSAQSAIYLRITCFDSDAGEAVSRSRVSNIETGAQVDTLAKGDGFKFNDPTSQSIGAYVRRGDLVASLLVSADAATEDLDASIDTVDKAMQRAEGAGGLDIPAPVTPAPTPVVSFDAGASPEDTLSPGETPNPSDAVPSPAAPSLEVLLPDKVGSYALTKSSYTGADLFEGDDSAFSRAITAALAKDGKTPSDLLVAQATEDSGALDLPDLWAMQVKGMSITTFEPIALEWFLSTGLPGITTTEQTIAGKKVKVIDYGPAASASPGASDNPAPKKSYAYVTGDVLILLTTGELTVAEQVLTAIK
jgi:hypothetical protein